MDLRKEWQKLQEEKFIQSSIKKEDIMKAIYQESNSTISTLRKRLKAKMNWTLFFLVGFIIFLLFNLENPDLVILLSVFAGAYLLGYIGMWTQYRQMSKEVDFSQPTLDLMKKNDLLVKRALYMERVFGVIFFPVAIIGGMLLSKVMNGGTIEDALQNSSFLIRGLILIIVLVPIMWWATNKMNKSAYGELMDRLSNNIRRLEDLS
jgi:flagellar biogenesis protein FliO